MEAKTQGSRSFLTMPDTFSIASALLDRSRFCIPLSPGQLQAQSLELYALEQSKHRTGG
ncbi:MAG: hypothetical protein KME64_03960 [Scytonematopsis contorta HA4267-MV1]|nr:hypothetical protein [Scytonematopsis contorta HA4267-MV1]